MGLCVAALCAPFVGRAIEADRAPILFSGGTLLGVASLLLWSLASSIEVFILSWIGIGIAQAATLVLELLGTLRFGRMSGLLAAPQTLMKAALPVTAGLLWSAGNNYSAVIVLLSIMVLTSLTMVVAARLASHNRAPGT